MNRTDTLSMLPAAGLARVAGDIEQLMQASIRMTSRALDEAQIPVGASKLGGLPDLPQETAWPVGKGSPLAFIAQINLADVRPYDTAQVLPPSGRLFFFYDAQQQTFGEAPEDRGGWQVLYDASDSPRLQRTPAPPGLPPTGEFTACAVAFSGEVTLPQRPAVFLPQLDWTSAELEHYEDFLSTYPTSEDRASIHHRLLGHPDQLQDDMHLQCALMSHGVRSVDDPRAAELAKTALEWQLLLQVDSDEQAGMKWATAGMLYYWIEREALRARDFGNIWLVLQAE